jgi:hypothetical protein
MDITNFYNLFRQIKSKNILTPKLLSLTHAQYEMFSSCKVTVEIHVHTFQGAIMKMCRYGIMICWVCSFIGTNYFNLVRTSP